MKSMKLFAIIILVIFLYQGIKANAEVMGTAFTYQGRLYDANNPANGLYDFQFNLCDSPTDGNRVANFIDVNQVDVNDGYFTVLLDFGSDVFNGDARWLDIAVRLSNQSEPVLYTVLSPRQQITPAPYALQTRGLFVNDDLRLGIGTTHPSYPVHIRKVHTDWLVGIHNYGTETSDRGLVVRADGGDPLLVQSLFGDLLNVKQNGNVGIGTNGPLVPLSLGAEMPPKAKKLAIWDGIDDFYGFGADWGRITIYTNNTEKMTVRDNGNVGIGTKNPLTDLEIQGTTGLRVTTGGAYSNVYGEFRHAYSGGLQINANAGGGWADISFQTDNTTKMFIESGGNVGIGTTSPLHKLDVNGPANLNSGISGGAALYVNGDEALWYNGTYFSWGYGGTANYFSDNVGIGTTSPARKLHVNDVMRLQPRSSAPSSPSEGDMYMDSTTHKLMVYDGTVWRACW